MSEPLKTRSELRPVHPIGDKIIGAILVAIGAVLLVAIAFPFVGIFVAALGAVLAISGIGMFVYGSRGDRDSRL